jgi:putative membrane protein
MVKFANNDRRAIHEAVLEVEKKTGAELAVVIMPASDAYRFIAFFTGLVVGSFAALALWCSKILTMFPLLLCLVLLCGLLFLLIPLLRHLCLKLEPVRVLKRRAALRAADEYMRLVHHLPSGRPVVLLYLSLAERYVHIYSSREVRAKIPDREWDAVVKTLTGNIKREGVRDAVVRTVRHAGEMLEREFPVTSATGS